MIFLNFLNDKKNFEDYLFIYPQIFLNKISLLVLNRFLKLINILQLSFK